MRLGERDLRAALGLVAEVGSCAGLDSFRAAVLPALRRVVPCEIASYNEIDSSRAQALAVVDPPEALFPGGAEALGAYADQNPLIACFSRRPNRRALKISDFMTRRELHRLDLYDLVYRPAEIEHQIAFVFPSDPPEVVGIALNRRRRDFTERDRAVLELLRPHLVRSYRDAALRERAAGLEAALDERREAVYLVQGGGRLEPVTAAARSLCAKSGGAIEALTEWAAKRGGRRVGGDPLDEDRLILIRGELRLVADRLPAPGEGMSAMVLVREENDEPSSPRVLRRLGLSRRQAEVLSLVATGRTNAEIARLLWISPLTVKKHLEAFYECLGVRSRSAAVATALRAAAGPLDGRRVPS